jgi:hypothetical protein
MKLSNAPPPAFLESQGIIIADYRNNNGRIIIGTGETVYGGADHRVFTAG